MEVFEEVVARDALEEEDGEGQEGEVIEQYQDAQELHYTQGKDTCIFPKKLQFFFKNSNSFFCDICG